MSSMRQLILGPLPPGRVEWIGVSLKRRGEIQIRESVDVQVGTGITEDHHARSGKSKRQVSLIQSEHLPVIGALLGRTTINPADMRRNLVISGVNLLALKGRRFQIGTAVLMGAGPCAPCSRMEENLGTGGYAAMRGHGGIVATVEEAGMISIGDPVIALSVAAEESE